MNKHRRPGTAAFQPQLNYEPPILADNDETASFVSRKSGATSMKSSLKSSMSGAKSNKNRR
jgi:hypothetical protein